MHLVSTPFDIVLAFGLSGEGQTIVFLFLNLNGINFFCYSALSVSPSPFSRLNQARRTNIFLFTQETTLNIVLF